MTNDPTNKEIKKGRILTGMVVSDKMNKTVVVEITRLRKHPKYKKYFKITRKFKAHDENNTYRIGDKVNIQEIRPMSKYKRWIVIGKV
ncbi:MAG: small subunit ribosomal protein S17 [Parcubacteria group bacterium Gr01-1014_44]|nr:MAG: small subunit ribosomal protein S17 [Parcubacteria group bacterium Gr01-1014_44]